VRRWSACRADPTSTIRYNRGGGSLDRRAAYIVFGGRWLPVIPAGRYPPRLTPRSLPAIACPDRGPEPARKRAGPEDIKLIKRSGGASLRRGHLTVL
jgi:hypothetical protein